MKLQIVEKLRSELVQPISAERQVVYILVETRKLLEHMETEKDEFETLEFYCDWAMHVELSRRAARTLLAKVDSYYTRLFQSGITPEEHRLLFGILCLEAFRGEFERFLGIHDLPVNICSSEDWP